MPRHTIAQGDSLTPLGATLKRKQTDGSLTAIDLTGLTVKATIVNTDETVEMAETTTGVTVVTAASGIVQYDFASGASALAVGTYYLYFVVYGAGAESTEKDTYPTPGEDLKLQVVVTAL